MSNSVMPKGVEHLTDRLQTVTQYAVSNSVMPKGVEHPVASFGGTGDPVSNSVMPKGVEHARWPIWRPLTRDVVSNSVMPKGVEHTIHDATLLQAVVTCRIQ